MTKKCDVIIVGGGIIGLMSAYYLNLAGRDVTVIERHEIGHGASRENCGLIFVSDYPPLCRPGVPFSELAALTKGTSSLYIKPGLDLGRLAFLMRFSLNCNRRQLARAMNAREALLGNSDRLYDAFFKTEKLPCDYEKRGLLIIHQTEKGMDAYGKTNSLLEPFDCAAIPLTGRKLQELEPALRENLFGAWYHQPESHLRPDRLVSELKQLLAKKGVVIHENCAMESIGQEKDLRIRVKTTKGIFVANHAILATGPWIVRTAKKLGWRLPIQPGKGYSITMPRPEKCPDIPCYFYDQNVVGTPWKSGFRLGGTMEFSGFNTDLNRHRLNALMTAADRYLKTPPKGTIENEWAALRPMSPDDLPVIDRAPGLRNIFVATGHGMLGITAAPSSAKLITEMVCNKTPHIDPTPFRMDRFQRLFQK